MSYPPRPLPFKREGGKIELELAQRANEETGTGFACRAKLSEILSAARVARFVRMTEGSSEAGNLTP